MAKIQKTDTSRSPLLQPVIERDYTRGLASSVQPGAQGGGETVSPPPGEPQPRPQPQPGTSAGTTPPTESQKPNYNPPPDDTTKSFSFDEDNTSASDLHDGEPAPPLTMPPGSARTFANFVGNAIQLYLPKATYAYVAFDMNNVVFNVEKGNLTSNFIEVFRGMNEGAKEALKIPDDNMKMWKAAFQHWLEYKQMTFANPTTELIAATMLLITDQGIRVYSLKKTFERYMKEAIEASKSIGAPRPAESQTVNMNNNGEAKAA
jgi:hypothetical protein